MLSRRKIDNPEDRWYYYYEQVTVIDVYVTPLCGPTMVYAFDFTNEDEDDRDQFQVDQGVSIIPELRSWFDSKYQQALLKSIKNEAFPFLHEDQASIRYLIEIVLQLYNSDNNEGN